MGEERGKRAQAATPPKKLPDWTGLVLRWFQSLRAKVRSIVALVVASIVSVGFLTQQASRTGRLKRHVIVIRHGHITPLCATFKLPYNLTSPYDQPFAGILYLGASR
jgi:hypothetical protein